LVSYVLSTLDSSKLFDIFKKKADRLIFEKLISLPKQFDVEYSFSTKEFGETLMMKITEPVTIKFYYFPRPFEIKLESHLAFIFRRNRTLLITSPRGIGLVTRGVPRNYVDNLIGRIVSKPLFEEKGSYQPVDFNSDQLSYNLWGEELRSIQLDIIGFGKIVFKGNKLNEKLNTEPSLKNMVNKGSVRNIKIHSKKLNRVVSIFRDGTIKTNIKSIDEIANYLIEILVPMGYL